MDDTFLQEQIDSTKEIITAYTAAILSLSSGTVKSFSLDTGQTRQTVTKKDLKSLHESLDSAYNQLEVLYSRLRGSGSRVIPQW